MMDDNFLTLDVYLNEESYDCSFLVENVAKDESKVRILNIIVFLDLQLRILFLSN